MRFASYKFLVLSACFLSTGCEAQSFGNSVATKVNEVDVRSEIKLCDYCPTFVRVPDAPKELRSIKYVSKYELTWNNYLAAYDDGSCPIPNPYAGYEPPKENNIPPHLEKYRIDWPIVLLGPKEVECYKKWLQEKTDLLVALPSEKEWEWFARAGRKNVKFPWGNEADPSKAAIKDTITATTQDGPLTYADGGKHIMFNVKGVKVGMFPPNDWGLYDIMGNSMELTADTISGEEWYRKHPNSEVARRTQQYDVVTIKGSARYRRDWSEHGISGVNYVSNFGYGYSTRVALRLILLNKGNK